jgi:hemolysin activation/secretion protein
VYHQSASTPNGASLTGASVGTIFQLGAYHALSFSFGHALAGNDRFSTYGSYEIHT